MKEERKNILKEKLGLTQTSFSFVFASVFFILRNDGVVSYEKLKMTEQVFEGQFQVAMAILF